MSASQSSPLVDYVTKMPDKELRKGTSLTPIEESATMEYDRSPSIYGRVPRIWRQAWGQGQTMR